MKKKHLLLPLLAGLLLSFGACSDDDDVTMPDYRKTVEAKISATIAMNQYSKAAGTSWGSGDKIGIYMKSAGKTLSESTILKSVNNVAYATTGNSSFIPASDTIYFPDLSVVPVDFVAYYPYTATAVSADFVYDINVADQSNQDAINFLYSNNAADRNNSDANVPLIFTSQLSTLKFNFTAIDGLTAADLKGIKVQIAGVNATAKFSLVDGTLSAQGDKTNVSPKVADNGLSAQAILIPSANISGTVMTFTLTNGTAINYTIPSGKYEANKLYVYDVSISDTASPVLNAFTSVVDGISITAITNSKLSYALGDAYPDASNPMAVVYEVSSDGKSGKAILSQTYTNAYWWSKLGAGFDPQEDGAKNQANGLANMNTIKAKDYWDVRYPIFFTVSKLGANWYIPAIDELKYLYNNRTTINTYISKFNGDPLLDYGWYLSSTEDVAGLVDSNNEPWNAVAIDFGNGANVRLYKSDAASYCVAICAF